MAEQNTLGSSSLTLAPCHVDKIERQVLCGTLSVPQDYQHPTATHINLNVTVLPAFNNSQNKSPMLFLAGGPGQAATTLASVIQSSHYEVLKNRDIILIDQRGTGKSSPLTCEDIEETGTYGLISSDYDMPKLVSACLGDITQDLSQFSSQNAIRDFDAVRQALGHEKVNLYGGSYGTRAALIYMRMFPETLSAVVLDAVSPIETPIGLFGQSSARAFNLMIKDCKADLACFTAFPNLETQFKALLKRVEDNPISITISHPRLTVPTVLKVDREKLISTVRFQLYSPRTRVLTPFVISEAEKGNYLPFSGMLALSEFGLEINTPLMMNIVCSEDIPRISAQQSFNDSNNNFGQGLSLQGFKRVCDHWPTYKINSAFEQPVISDIPTLILSGRLDPVTPPSNGETVHSNLSNSAHIVVENTAHIVAGNGCSGKIIAGFLDDKQPDLVDGSCLENIPPMPFITNINGN